MLEIEVIYIQTNETEHGRETTGRLELDYVEIRTTDGKLCN